MKRQTIEELFNAISHGIGALLAIAGLVLLLYYSISENHSIWHITSFAIYGSSLVALYLSSTLYHSFFKMPKAHSVFKVFDHASIYLLIAGTYTPFLFIPLHGSVGTPLAIFIWTVAVIGIGLKVFFAKRFNTLSTLCYVAMGWLIMFYLDDLLASIPAEAFYWLLAGGLSYTVGSVFYLMKKLPFSHCVWHMFVLGGSVTHFVAVFFYLRHIPIAG